MNQKYKIKLAEKSDEELCSVLDDNGKDTVAEKVLITDEKGNSISLHETGVQVMIKRSGFGVGYICRNIEEVFKSVEYCKMKKIDFDNPKPKLLTYSIGEKIKKQKEIIFQKENCMGCEHADSDVVLTGEPCCLFDGDLDLDKQETRCLSRKQIQ